MSCCIAIPVRQGSTSVGRREKIAAVICETGRGAIRQLRLVDEIALSNFKRANAQLVRRQVEEALRDVNCFGAPGAAIGIGRSGIGEYTLGAKMINFRTFDTHFGD